MLAALRSFFDVPFWQQLIATLAGVAVGIPVALWLTGPGEVLVSSTVKDLVAGSGLRLADRGTHALKGVPDPWRLFGVEQ